MESTIRVFKQNLEKGPKRKPREVKRFKPFCERAAVKRDSKGKDAQTRGKHRSLDKKKEVGKLKNRHYRNEVFTLKGPGTGKRGQLF